MNNPTAIIRSSLGSPVGIALAGAALLQCATGVVSFSLVQRAKIEARDACRRALSVMANAYDAPPPPPPGKRRPERTPEIVRHLEIVRGAS
jgi:hypothetical protein